MILSLILLSACVPPKAEAPVPTPVVDQAAEVVEVPAVPCAGNAAHFAQHGTRLALVFHDEKTDTRFQWMVQNVKRADDGAWCEVASGAKKGQFVPMSCLQPIDGTTAPVGDCPVAVTCLYRTANGSDCATGTKPVAGPANGITAEEAYRLAGNAWLKADHRDPSPATSTTVVRQSTTVNTVRRQPATPTPPDWSTIPSRRGTPPPPAFDGEWHPPLAQPGS